MVTVDFDGIEEVIRNDAAIRFRYKEDGQTCVIGGLAEAAGFDLDGFLAGFEASEDSDVNSDNIEVYRYQFVPMITAIRNRFGLSVRDLGRLQKINDQYGHIDIRHIALLEEVAIMRLEAAT